MKTKKIKASVWIQQMYEKISNTFGQEFLNEFIKDKSRVLLYNSYGWEGYITEEEYLESKKRLEIKSDKILQAGILKSN
jgi:hypothetical protein